MNSTKSRIFALATFACYVVIAGCSKALEQPASALGVAEDELDMTNVEAFYVLDGSYIDGSLERAIEEYGSMEAYVRDGLGLKDEEIENLRGQLLESTLE